MIQGIVAAVGLATSIVGMSKAKKAKKAQARAVAEQNAALGEVAAASRAASEASMRAEMARKEQMNLDANRAKRETIRQSMIARATSLTRSYGQGAGESSGARGAEAQITGVLGYGLTGIRQNQALGNQIFQANYDVFEANARGADAQTRANQAANRAGTAQSNVNFGQSLFSTGLSIMGSADRAGRVISTSTGSLFQ